MDIFDWTTFLPEQWYNMTQEEWQTFLLTSMDTSYLNFWAIMAGQRILCVSNTAEMDFLRDVVIHVNYDNTFDDYGVGDNQDQDEAFLRIGGVPLTLAKKNGQYALQVICETGPIPTNENMYFYGWRFPVYAESIYNSPYQPYEVPYNRVFVIDDSPITFSADTDINVDNNYTFMWQGIPMALDIDRSLIMKQFVPTTPLEETAFATIGGTPYIVERYGSRWYLVVTSWR